MLDFQEPEMHPEAFLESGTLFTCPKLAFRLLVIKKQRLSRAHTHAGSNPLETQGGFLFPPLQIKSS